LGLAGLAFAACSNDEDITNQKDGDKVLLKLSLGRTEQTRAVETSAAGLFNNVLDLKAYFFTSDSRRLEIDAESQAKNEAELAAAVATLNNAGTTERVATIALTGVPATATQIYVVANENTPIQTGNLDAARNTTIYLKGLVKRAGEMECVFAQQNSLMTGLAGIADGGDGVATANVQITPVSSRVEIQKLTAMKVEGNDVVNIENFQLKGIYVNRFYSEGKLDPEKNAPAEDRNRIDHFSVTTDYTEENYTNKGFDFMCNDYTAVPIASVASATTNAICEVNCPEENMCWGYPVLAGKQNGEQVDGVYDVANIVIELSVKMEGVAERRNKYLTIIGYKQANADQTPVLTFARRNVYRINDLQFNINDLTDVPYEGTKSVTATVTVLPWIGVPVTPEFH
ncbi:hypothetical protein, partial [uncultured Bacteroides sp.]|uniref:hypothetical protein n=1 Tax=uncultured Bacteroides sp. TaxID=162156 RepID=UPI0026047442